MSRLQTLLLALLCLILTFLLVVLVAQIVDQLQQKSIAAAPTVLVIITPTNKAPTSTPTNIPASSTPTAKPTNTPPPTWTPTYTPSPTPTYTPTPTKTPTPTITPSPLPPRRPTAIPITPTATPGIDATATPSGTLPIPTPVARYPIPADAITIILLGSDKRPDWHHWNTDVMQYVVVYPDIPAVSVLSIPRDLYVYIPNVRMSRINTADMYGEMYGFDGGGIGLLNQTLLYNLGITADYYAKVNFQGFEGLVDLLGGIDIPVHCYLTDYWPYPDENGEFHKIALEPRVHHMDGKLALWYSRTRKTTSVFSREARQQQVLEAMWHKAKQTNLLTAIPSLYEQTRDLYQTDLGVGNILALAVTAAQIDSTDVRMYNIGRYDLEFFITPQGGNVYLPIWEEVEPIIDAAITRPAASRAARADIRVEVWNGTPYADWDWLAADRLAQYGYTPVVRSADRRDYAQTSIIVFGSTGKGTGLAYIQRIFNVNNANVTYVENTGQDVKLRLIIGQDYNTCP